MFTKYPVSLVCALCVVLVCQVQAGNVTVQLTLISYSNPTGRDWLNQRCDDIGIVSGVCDTYLMLCLDALTGAQRGYTSDLDDCSYYTSPPSQRFTGHSPTLTDEGLGPLFPNPIEYNISDWQGGFLFKVATYDADRFTSDDAIDVLLYTYNDPPAESLEEAGAGVTQDVSGARKQGTKTMLKFNLLVYCSEFFYHLTPPAGGTTTDPCSVYCKPQDSPTGHYTCSETGQIQCLPGWINEASNCITSTNRQADIPTNNTKVITGTGVDNTAQVVGTGSFFGDHKNIIIGLIIGLFLLLLIIVLLIALLLRNKRKRKLKDQGSSAYVNTAVAGQQTAMTTTASAGTAACDNPLYLNKPAGAPAESHYADVDYSMVKLPIGGGQYLPEAIPPAVGKAREAAGLSTDNYYDRNLKYNPKNTQPSPYIQEEISRSRYGMGGNERGAHGGSDGGMSDGVRGGFSPMGGDSPMYGFSDSRFENPTYEAPSLDVDVPGKVSVVKKMAGIYNEPIKYKM